VYLDYVKSTNSNKKWVDIDISDKSLHALECKEAVAKFWWIGFLKWLIHSVSPFSNFIHFLSTSLCFQFSGSFLCELKIKRLVWLGGSAAPVVPSFSLQWKYDESTKHYITQMLLAINWYYWHTGENFHACVWRFKVSSYEHLNEITGFCKKKIYKCQYFSDRPCIFESFSIPTLYFTAFSPLNQLDTIVCYSSSLPKSVSVDSLDEMNFVCGFQWHP
jgi:hypothetical protein